MIYALHGFLGRPSDWNFLREAGFDVASVDLFRDDPFDFLARASSEDVILGYSMGGRLALHALLQKASARKAVIVSAGLGVEGDEERERRRQADERWARRFETEPWDSLISEWNGQPALAGPSIPRLESDFDRLELAAALRRWSPAALPPVRQRLAEIQMPILWVAGERDATYVAAAREGTAALTRGELWIAAGCGHRVPWEQPSGFLKRMREFIERE